MHNRCKPKDVKELQEGPNGTTVNVKNKTEANELLNEAFPNYQKVAGIGSQDAQGLRRKHKTQEFDKKVGRYHKDYGIDFTTGRVYGHDMNNPHGEFPHINIRRLDGKKVIINIIGG